MSLTKLIDKEHHNWAKYFGSVVPSLDDVTNVVKKAISSTDWKSTGKVLHGNGGKVIGEGVIINTVVEGKQVWVEGTKLSSGTIIIKNAGVN